MSEKLSQVILLVFFCMFFSSEIQSQESPGVQHYEVLQRMKVEEDITAETTDLLGDRIDLSSGSLSFQVTDAVLPGQNGLDIVISRSWRGGRFGQRQLSMADWALEIPRIQTSAMLGTTGFSGSWGRGKQCSGSIEPTPFLAGTTWRTEFEGYEYFNGVNLIVPGVANEKLFQTGNKHKTRSNWRFECITLSNGEEGYKGLAPNGLTYIFDREYNSFIEEIPKNNKAYRRHYLYLYASSVSDRFGNSISYNYDASGRLTSIKSSDGRFVTVVYSGDSELIDSILTEKGEWSYDYENTSNGKPFLTKVTLPDGKYWSYDLSGLFFRGRSLSNLRSADCVPGTLSYEGVVEHPYGVKGTFTLHPTYHGRTKTPGTPLTAGGEPSDKHCFAVASLQTKKLEIPAGSTSTWQYSYSENSGGWLSNDGGDPPKNIRIRPDLRAKDIKTTSVLSPTGAKTIHHFSRAWDWREGHEVRREYYDIDGSTLIRQIDTYVEKGVNTYTTEHLAHNEYDLPTLTHEYNDVNEDWVRYTRRVYDQVYASGKNYQLLNLPKTVEISKDQKVWHKISEVKYYPENSSYAHAPKEYYSNGLLKKAHMSYHASGEVYRVEFPNISGMQTRTWLEYSNYYRGEPQKITIPRSDNASGSLAATRIINSAGKVTSFTDFSGNNTKYEYDAMYRLNFIDHPDHWQDRHLFFIDADDSDREITSKNILFKREAQTGEQVVTTYFDGLLRPILVKRHDTASGEVTFKNERYNVYGNKTFSSLWSTSAKEIEGTHMEYDGLDRLVFTRRSVQVASTETSYLSNNRIQVNDTRGYKTITQYLAYGQPETNKPVYIESPHQSTAAVEYNLFGNQVSITQNNVTETRIYNSNQKLCRVSRPEFGDKAFAYHSTGQLYWSAEGVGSSTSSDCAISKVSNSGKVFFSYNSLGLIQSVDYPDSSPDLSYAYDENGRLKKLSSNGLGEWQYNYNSLGLLDDETLNIDGKAFTLDYEYDSLGALSATGYPSGRRVNYAPNAFGQPTRVGSFIDNVKYHPNGVIKSFEYGNGVFHETRLNSWGLPEESSDSLNAAFLQKLTLEYDQAFNLEAVIDGVDDNYSIAMSYDGLNRLKGVDGFWGSGELNYDGSGNILEKQLGEEVLTYHYDPNTHNLKSVTGQKNYSFDYDSRGNVTANGKRNFKYNLANRLTESGGANYRYDGHNRRVKKTVAGKTTYSLYSLSGKLLYLQKESGDHVDHLYLGDKLTATVESR